MKNKFTISILALIITAGCVTTKGFNNEIVEEATDLDHVFAANSVKILQNNGSDVSVIGWPQAQDKDLWISKFSDHAILYFEVTN